MKEILKLIYIMLTRIKDFVTTHAGDFAGLPDFTEITAELTGINSLIAELQKKLDVSSKGLTDAKNEARLKLIDSTLLVLKRLRAYAGIEGESQIKADVNITDSALRIIADALLEAQCRSIKDQATSLLTELAPYGVTEAMLMLVETDCKAFNARLNQTKQYQVAQKLILQEIATLAKKGEALLTNKMDKLAELLEKTKPETFNNYFENRKIGKVAHRNLSIWVSVMEAESGTPVSNATVTIETAAENGGLKAKAGGAALVKHVKRTSVNGGCQLKNLPTGTYTVIASKSGFVTKTRTVYINEHEVTRSRFDMDPMP